jgi:hypothetical protein
MFGRATASQIASASLPSFLPLLRYGVTNFAAISFTVCPNEAKRRAHSWAPEHASMPIRHGGNCATSSLSFARESVRRSTTSPFELTPCNEKLLFAKSIPSVETRFMGLPLSQGSISQLNPDTSVSFRDGEVPYIR